MWRLIVLVTFSSVTLGCHHYQYGRPDATETVVAPAQKIEVLAPEKLVVKAPSPDVVVEGEGYGSGGGGSWNDHQVASACAAGDHRRCKHQPHCNPPAVPMQPAPYGSAPAYGAAMMGGEIRDRTEIGFVYDPIRIPLPWFRLRAIPRPAEVTFRSQLAPTQNYGSPVMMPMAQAPVPMAFGAAPAGPVYGAPMPMAPAGPVYGAAPQGPVYGAPPTQTVVTGTQTIPVQGYMPVQVPVNPGNAYGAGAACPPQESTADAIARLKQKQQECLELQKQINELKGIPQTPEPEKKP